MYKVGDEVLVKATIIQVDENFGRYVLQADDGKILSEEKDKVFPADMIADMTADMTAEEAWSIAEKVIDISYNDRVEKFGTSSFNKILKKFTPHQARDILVELEMMELEVGDEVEHDGIFGIVTFVRCDFIDVVLKNGEHRSYGKGSFRKTGKHLNISGLLSMIGGE